MGLTTVITKTYDCHMKKLVWYALPDVGGFPKIRRKLFSTEWEKHYELNKCF